MSGVLRQRIKRHSDAIRARMRARGVCQDDADAILAAVLDAIYDVHELAATGYCKHPVANGEGICGHVADAGHQRCTLHALQLSLRMREVG